MNTRKLPYRIQYSLESTPAKKQLSSGLSYDPELLYVECRHCGMPVLWEEGKTTELLKAGGVDMTSLNERCLIVADGCPACLPPDKTSITLAVLRLSDLEPGEEGYLNLPPGHA